MGKEAYYFSHDSNAQDDPKCMLLIDQLGMEGYGIFWGLIERLRNEPDYKLPLFMLPSLAKRWGTSAEKVQTVVSKFGLFIFEDDKFFSARLLRSMNERSERGRLNASKRWENRVLDATAMQLQCNGNATAMQNDANKGKERKEKEKKEKENSGNSFLEKFRNDRESIEQAVKYAKAMGRPITIEALMIIAEAHDLSHSMSFPFSDYFKWKQYLCYAIDKHKSEKPKNSIGGFELTFDPEKGSLNFPKGL